MPLLPEHNMNHQHFCGYATTTFAPTANVLNKKPTYLSFRFMCVRAPKIADLLLLL